jgi:hypothetical protein
MVDGSVLMSDRVVRTLDETHVRELARAQAFDLAQRAGVHQSVVRRGPKARL